MNFYLDDLEADFRAFYHLTPADVARMSGPHFLALAWRITAYQGAVAARFDAENDGTTSRARGDEPGGRVDSTPTAIQHDAALADVIDYG